METMLPLQVSWLGKDGVVWGPGWEANLRDLFEWGALWINGKGSWGLDDLLMG